MKNPMFPPYKIYSFMEQTYTALTAGKCIYYETDSGLLRDIRSCLVTGRWYNFGFLENQNTPVHRIS